jgi:MFS family permease
MLQLFKHISNEIIKSNQVFSSFESRNYRFFFTGQSISLLGSWMQTIAMAWLIYRLTGSKFLLGFVGFTNQIPSFFLSPFTGVFTDRFDRRKIMLWAQIIYMLQALLLSLLVFLNLIEIWHIIALSLLFGLVTAFDTPARHALVVDLIDDPKNLGNAIALNSAMFNSARLIGPAIAGVVIAIVGEGICFLINAVSYIAIIWALYKIRAVKNERREAENSLKDEFTEGLKYTFGFKPFRSLLLLLAVISFIGAPFGTLMPAFASEILKGGSHTYGFLMSATGAGALIGAIYLASRKSVIGMGKIIMLNSILFGLCLSGISFCIYQSISMVIAFIAGFCMIAVIACINTLIQTLAEENKRGRVMSFYAMALLGMNPIGSLMAGTMATGIGISYTLLLCGVITILFGIWFTVVWPMSRQYIYPIYIEKGFIQKR